MTSHEELVNTVNRAAEEAYEIILSTDGWKEVKSNEHGDTVVSKKSKSGRMIYRLHFVVDVAPDKLIPALQDISKITEWNKTLSTSEIVLEVNDAVAISYQITAEGGGGVVSARDFILISKK